MLSHYPTIQQALQSALTGGVVARLCFPVEGRVHKLQARFVGVESDGIWFEMQSGDACVIVPMIESGARARVLIPLGMHHLQCNGAIVKIQTDFTMHDGTHIRAFRIDLPVDAVLSTRRKHFRMHLTFGDILPTLRIWKIQDRISLADRPLPSSELEIIEIIDISEGGLRIRVKSRNPASSLQMSSDQRLRIELLHEDKTFLIESRLRHPHRIEPGCDSIVLGIEFTSLESNAIGRRTACVLRKLLGAIQRKKLRERNAA